MQVKSSVLKTVGLGGGGKGNGRLASTRTHTYGSLTQVP